MTKYLLSTIFCAMLFVLNFTSTEKNKELSFVNYKTSRPPSANKVLDGTKPTITLTSKKAFPTAEGFGKNASGGRNGKVIHVTNLNANGSGSFDAALRASGPRTIVFDVSGEIVHSGGDYLDIGDDNVTIAGETAPDGGITVKGAELRISVSNVILRNLKIRPGSNVSGSNVNGIRASSYNSRTIENLIFDHISTTWATDKSFIIGGNGSNEAAKNITVQHSIVAENIGNDLGFLLYANATNISIHKNLLVHNRERNIRSSKCNNTFEMVNNFVYGFQYGTQPTYTNRFDVIGNVYKTSGQSTRFETLRLEATSQCSIDGTLGHFSDNTLDGKSITISSNLSGRTSSRKILNSGLPILNNSQVINAVTEHVGSYLYRDSADSRIIKEALNGTGAVKNSVSDAGGYPKITRNSRGSTYYKTLRDIPENFVIAHGITSNSQIKDKYDFGTYQVLNEAGYSALEMYLFWKAGDFDRMPKIDVEIPEDEVVEKDDACADGLANEDASILLSNGKFVSGLDTAKAIASDTNGSPCAIQLQNGDNGQPWAKLHIPINLADNGLQEGDKIFFSLDGKDNKNGARVKVAQDNTPHTYLIDYGYSPNWSTYTKTITVPGGISTLDIWLYTNYALQSSGSAVFDNLIVKKVEDGSSGSGGNGPECDNGLTNEDPSISLSNENFVSGLDTAKTINSGTSGSPCALELTNNDYDQPWAKLHIPINLADNGLKAGDKIFFSLDGKDNKSGARVKVAQDNTPHTYLIDHGYNSDWSNYSKTITVPNGISTLDIWLYTNYALQSSGSGVFDNLIVKKVEDGSSGSGGNGPECDNGLANEDASIALSKGGMVSGLDAAKTTAIETNGSPCAIELTNHDSGQPWAKLHIPINLADNGLQEGDKIFFSLDGKGDNSGVRVKLAQNNTPHTYLIDHGYNSDWSTYSTTITVPGGISTLDIWLYTNYATHTNGSAVFDNLVVRKTTVTSTSLKMAADYGTQDGIQPIENLSVYPNPTQGDVNVSIPDTYEFVGYELYAPSGVLVKQENIEGHPGNLPLTIPSDQQGLFILRLTHKNGEKEVLKIIKK